MTLAGELYRDALAQSTDGSGLTDKIDAFAAWLDQQQRLVSTTATLFSGSEIVKSLLVRDNISSTIFNSSSSWQASNQTSAAELANRL